MDNPLVVGMDNGLQAAAAVMQQDPRGRVNVLSECYVPESETMGVETFLDRLLVPHLTSKYKANRSAFLFVLDPACFQRSQVNEATIAQAVMTRGFRAIKASTNDPAKRQDAMEGLLNRAVDGKAGILFDPGCKYLSDGMEWGYRYKRNATTGLSSTQRDKTHHSHLCEAAEYAALHFNARVNPTYTLMGSRAREVKRTTYSYV
jgi:hypothetical protein